MARRIPADLAADGRALWRRIHAWMAGYDERGLTLDPHEEPLVAELCRTADRLASLREALSTVEVTDPAWTRLACEERQQRLAYGRVVSALGFPSGVVESGEKVVGLSPRSRRAQKASRSRWDRQRARSVSMGAG